MKSLYTLLALFLISFTIHAQIVDIPDAVLKNILVNGYCVDIDGDGDGDTDADINNDGEIQVAEAEAILGLYLPSYNSVKFSSIEGIEAFTNLEVLNILNNTVVTLDVSLLTNLTKLDCTSNQLTFLNVNGLSNLTELKCTNNQLSSLDLSTLENLTKLECQHNQFATLNTSALTNLNFLDCSNNQLAELDTSSLINLDRLYCYSNQLTELDTSALVNLTGLSCFSNQLTELDISTLLNLNTLACNDNQLNTLNTGILTNLTFLNCNNNQFTTLDVSTLLNLESLYCNDNQLTEIDVSNLSNLNSLYCHSNQISTLNAGLSSNLTFLDCSNNLLTSIEEDSLTSLTSLNCSGNELSEIDVNTLVNLNSLNCNSNQLSELDLTSSNLYSLYCNNNLLTSLDVSNSRTHYLDCSNNLLINLNVKNGFVNWNGTFDAPYNTQVFDFSNNPNLINVCADDEPIYVYDYPYEEINIVQFLINQYGYTNCAVNGYCSFTPGGDFYTIEGNVTLDIDANGCDTNDSNFPNLNFAITNGTETGNFIANSSGIYNIHVQEGSHTITPTFESTDYFTVSPSIITVDFPSDTSPFMQDFCITSNGTYNDLEITIIPINVARPGFDIDYKLIYKNKGTTTLSGDIDFGFQDDLMDFISSSPTEDAQTTNMLTWNFTDLAPFESREVLLTMNLNSPMDTPPVNGDDLLAFIATLNIPETDQTPDDNTFELNQTVVNSFDPNDKTCLEGDFITPEMVGKYVHYMIRFENTGTANAINVVVKDEIDRTKFDLSTLVPVDASHEFFARIQDDSDNYYVEFIFENINLPFDDANNDGYLVFKIKTLDTLVLEDTFENEAEIYFDFNFPIITNTAQTTVATLGTEDLDLVNNTISLYPNPTTHILHLESKQAIKQIVIYDISGRNIKEISIIGSRTNMNISTLELSTGTYFVKIKTTLGETVKKVIKD